RVRRSSVSLVAGSRRSNLVVPSDPPLSQQPLRLAPDDQIPDQTCGDDRDDLQGGGHGNRGIERIAYVLEGLLWKRRNGAAEEEGENEIVEGCHEGEERGGEDARASDRQRHQEDCPPSPGSETHGGVFELAVELLERR